MDIEEAGEIRRRIAALPEPYRSNFNAWLLDNVVPLECASKVRLATVRELLLRAEEAFGRFGGEK